MNRLVTYRVTFRNSVGDETTRNLSVTENEFGVVGADIWGIARLYSEQNPIVGVATRCEYVSER
jgi:hypothetical protein